MSNLKLRIKRFFSNLFKTSNKNTPELQELDRIIDSMLDSTCIGSKELYNYYYQNNDVDWLINPISDIVKAEEQYLKSLKLSPKDKEAELQKIFAIIDSYGDHV